jgi:preprotein translocase subunit SecY
MAELARRAAFSLAVLLLYRLGSNIPLPGIDAEAWGHFLHNESGGLRSLLLFTGGSHRLAMFALNLTPYISAAVILQLATIVCRPLRALNAQGQRGRQVVRKLTLGLTALLAAFQAYGIALGIEGLRASSIIVMPKSAFVLSTVATLTGGALLLAWLSEQITLRGIGNGIALILLAGATTALSEPILAIRELAIRGHASSNLILSLAVMTVVVTGVVVVMERARRNFRIQYAERQIGDRVLGSVAVNLPVKLNSAGLIPVILASLLLSILSIGSHLLGLVGAPYLANFANQVLTERPVFLTLYAIFIFLGAFFYAAYLLDPEDIASRLQQSGASIPSIAPGEPTALHIDNALSRITLIGALYLVLVCLLPELLISVVKVPIYFGGQLLLVLVCTALDLDAQVRASLARYRRG